MLQKEVVDRVVALPSTADYGAIGDAAVALAMEDVLFVPPESSTRRPGQTAPWAHGAYPQPAVVDAALLEGVQVLQPAARAAAPRPGKMAEQNASPAV
jgi:16S rRNA (adenine1518-N6/adenine1519-N6)-dimethyltransferase